MTCNAQQMTSINRRFRSSQGIIVGLCAVAVRLSPIVASAQNAVMTIEYGDGSKGACQRDYCKCDIWVMRFYHPGSAASWASDFKTTLPELIADVQTQDARTRKDESANDWQYQWASRRGPFCIVYGGRSSAAASGSAFDLTQLVQKVQRANATYTTFTMMYRVITEAADGEATTLSDSVKEEFVHRTLKEYADNLHEAHRQLARLNVLMDDPRKNLEAIGQGLSVFNSSINAATTAANEYRSAIIGSPQSLPARRCLTNYRYDPALAKCIHTSSPPASILRR